MAEQPRWRPGPVARSQISHDASASMGTYVRLVGVAGLAYGSRRLTGYPGGSMVRRESATWSGGVGLRYLDLRVGARRVRVDAGDDDHVWEARGIRAPWTSDRTIRVAR